MKRHGHLWQQVISFESLLCGPAGPLHPFSAAYAGQAAWDMGRPQKPFLKVADRTGGPVLDAGCGTGDTALFFAGRGCKVTGIDLLEEAIRRAKRKSAERGVPVTFLVQDARTLKDWSGRESPPGQALPAPGPRLPLRPGAYRARAR